VLASAANSAFVDAGLHVHASKLAEGLHKEAIDQAEKHHRDDIKLQLKLFAKEFRTEMAHFREQQKQAEMHHLEELFQTEAHHKKEYELEWDGMERENARDVWAAKGRKLEALFIMTTLMFACFIALLCEGMPPAAYDASSQQDVNNTAWGYHAKLVGLDGPLMVLWAVVAALASGGLISTLYMLIWAHDKMSHYNIYNQDQLYTKRRFEHLNRKKQDNQKKSESYIMYEKYYAAHCEQLVTRAQQSFHVSTYLTMILATITLSARLAVNYHSEVGAVAFVVIISVMLLFVLVMHMTLRLNPMLDKKIEYPKDQWSKMEKAADNSELAKSEEVVTEHMKTQLQEHSEFLLQQLRPLTNSWVNGWMSQQTVRIEEYASKVENGEGLGPTLVEAGSIDDHKMDATENQGLTYSTVDPREFTDKSSSLDPAFDAGQEIVVGYDDDGVRVEEVRGRGDPKYFSREKRHFRPDLGTEKRSAKQHFTAEL